MNHELIDSLGDELYGALTKGTVVEPLTSRHADITVEDAYRIQQRLNALRIAAGERVIGKKIGVTSKAVMDMLGVHQPDFGLLTDGMVYNEGEAIPASTLIQPKAEGEIAFVLKRRLQGPGVTAADVLAATEGVMACFEIVDSRIRDWKIRIQDTVADNASCGVFVLGDRVVDPRDVDLQTCGMVLEKNGEVVVTGAGAAALGSPLNAVAWLANTLGRLDIALEPGEVVLSGSLGAMVPVKAGRQPAREHRRHRRLLGALRLNIPMNSWNAMTKKVKCALIGPGNIGTDLLAKLQRSPVLEPVWMVGIDPESDGLKKARELGLKTTADGVDGLLPHVAADGIQIAFDATSAYVHEANSRKLNALGVMMIDLTPAAIGPYCVPPVNLREHVGRREMNVNMVTCGGQATIPMVYAVSRVQAVRYAEIVATVSSRSAGPGTRKNIDEFTRTTAGAVAKVGGAKQGKAIIVINPADPPLIMRDTVHCLVEGEPKVGADRGLGARDGRAKCRSTCPATGWSTARCSTASACRSTSKSRVWATTCRSTRATWTS